MKKLITFSIVLADLLSFYLTAQLSLLIYNSGFFGLARTAYPFRIDLLLTGMIIYIIVLYYSGSYRRSRDFIGIARLVGVVNGSFIAGMIFVFFIFLYQLSVPRILLLLIVASLPIISIFCRLLVNTIESRILNKYIRDKTLVYGAGEKGISFVNMNRKVGESGLDIIGFIDDTIDPNPAVGNPKPVLGSIDDVQDLAVQHHIDRIIVAIRKPSKEAVEKLKLLSADIGFTLSFIPTQKLWEANPVKIRDYSGLPLVDVEAPLLDKPFYNLVKRCGDVLISIAGIIIAAPLWALIAASLKIANHGTILFKHKRVGLNGKEFTLYKFRTLIQDTNPYAATPSSSADKRITLIGKWLRKTSLDELPQLFNVFKGDMSIVGPRPEMPFIVEKYEDYTKRRLMVKPGITGLWQVSRARTAAIHDNPEYDLHYVENRGFALDLIIMLMTVVFVVRSFTH